jgi:2-methylcitrate dehydratase PrpD
VAVALVEGAAGERQYSDRAVRDPQIVALRGKVTAVVDPAIKAEQVDMTITLTDGRKLHKFIAHAIGSLEVPMSDKQLEAKFRDLADGILPAAQVNALLATCWNVEQLPSAAAIAQGAVKRS